MTEKFKADIDFCGWEGLQVTASVHKKSKATLTDPGYPTHLDVDEIKSADGEDVLTEFSNTDIIEIADIMFKEWADHDDCLRDERMGL